MRFKSDPKRLRPPLSAEAGVDEVVFMAGFRHKYEEKIAALPNCPPVACTPCRRRAYRFGFADAAHPRQGIPALAISPRRALKWSHVEQCSGWALSAYVRVRAALKEYRKLKGAGTAVERYLGTHIEAVILTPEDGLLSPPDDDGHYDFHEAATFDGRSRFRRVVDLT
jgi:hypothetical protein